MRNIVNLTDEMEAILLSDQYMQQNKRSRSRLELYNLLYNAIDELLTDKQREYVKLYYFEGLAMPKIAERLGVNKSTVFRGLAAAKKHLHLIKTLVEIDEIAPDPEEDFY